MITAFLDPEVHNDISKNNFTKSMINRKLKNEKIPTTTLLSFPTNDNLSRLLCAVRNFRYTSYKVRATYMIRPLSTVETCRSLLDSLSCFIRQTVSDIQFKKIKRYSAFRASSLYTADQKK